MLADDANKLQEGDVISLTNDPRRFLCVFAYEKDGVRMFRLEQVATPELKEQLISAAAHKRERKAAQRRIHAR